MFGRPSARWLSVGMLITLLVMVSANLFTPRSASSQSSTITASEFEFFKLPTPQSISCTGIANDITTNPNYTRADCGFGDFTVVNLPAGEAVKVRLYNPGTTIQFAEVTTTRPQGTFFRFLIRPTAMWPAGVIPFQVFVGTATTPAGGASFLHNALGATVTVGANGGKPYRVGEAIPLTGRIFRQDTDATGAPTTPAAAGATANLVVLNADSQQQGAAVAITADPSGNFSTTIPAGTTGGIVAGPESNYQTSVSIEVRDAANTSASEGAFAAQRAGAGSATISAPPSTLILENSFVSSVGWVKPGSDDPNKPSGLYPFRVFVRNFTLTPFNSVSVTIPVPDGTDFLSLSAQAGTSAVENGDGSITWTVGTVPAAADDGTATVRTLVVQAQADSFAEDPQIVWKNLSSTATLTYAGQPVGTSITSTSHGPKVIPPDKRFDTARYGDRPFPVVPVDWRDRKHAAANTGDELNDVINDPTRPGSTFNLFQEISYGQLFPAGDVPSSAIASEDFGDATSRAAFQSKFTKIAPTGTCKGATLADIPGAVGGPTYAERVKDGWYQMPGDTEYYGGDKFGSAVAGSVAGVGAIFDIDGACGPTGKAVYDAAAIADPEIDYSDFDTDKDGVVDFFMMLYVGLGGNGASQLNAPPYDNIWPHSSSLEFYYTDANGQKGDVSDDQLKDLEGRPLFYTDASRSQMTTTPTAFTVFVRVGPYNVNPESSIAKASVISHEYGHSLGLPDFYSTGTRETYGTWNLMASDHSQHMDIFGKQELGWLVPRVLDTSTNVTNWQDSKRNTKAITWKTPAGETYTLTGDNVNNGEGYVAKLPARAIIDPQKIIDGATPTHVWWTGSGNDFGCPPNGGHNLDIILPGMAEIAANTQTKLTFKSLWDIEWDFDYGYVLISTNGGQTYTSLPSEKGYTTPASTNPNANGCQAQYGNGVTGSSGSYRDGTQAVDRVTGTYPTTSFIEDSYDLTAYAGMEQVVLRFSYATDPGLAKPGWFIDDLAVKAGTTEIYTTDFEGDESDQAEPGSPDDPAIYNGGCRDSLRSATQCTDGWQYVDAAAGSPADHAYYLEMRDRSGFDLNGRGQSDRGDPTFAPGLSLIYTDESHGYGNTGTSNPPAQNPLDSQPQPGNDTPNLDDAAWTAASGDNRFSDSGAGHVDNYTDPSRDDEQWRFDFDCLTFDVTRMDGNDVGPETVPGNLNGDANFTIGTGCAAFDYGFSTGPGSVPGGTIPNSAPMAKADVRAEIIRVNDEVTFDGSQSTDDRQEASQLTYSWNFGDGSPAVPGQQVKHTFTEIGAFTVTLTVTDADSATDNDTVVVTVVGADATGTPTQTVAPTSTVRPEPPTVTATSGPGNPTTTPTSPVFTTTTPTTTSSTNQLYLPFVAR